MTVTLDLKWMPGAYAVVRLAGGSGLPDWAVGGVVSVTFAPDETSIVCLAGQVPDGAEVSPGWRMMQLTTKFEFDEAGVVLSVVRPLSEAGLGVFVTSTFYRDYVLVRADETDNAQALLTNAGHHFAD